MRLVVERPVDLPVAHVRRALGDPEGLIAVLSVRLEPLPPEPGMARHWRVTGQLGGLPREGRVWLPAPMPADACRAVARMDGIRAELALEAEADRADRAGRAVLRADLRVAASGLRGHAVLAVLRVAEPALRQRLEVVLDRVAGALVARQGAV